MDRVIYERPDTSRGLRSDREHFLVNTKNVSLKNRILLSPIFKYVLPGFGVVIALIAGVYAFMYFVLNESDNDWPATCNIRMSYRVDCFPGKNPTYDECIRIGCCWHDENELCSHSIPSRHGYTPRISNPNEEKIILSPRKSTSPLGSMNADPVILELNNVDANHVEIILRMSQTETRGTNFDKKASSNDEFVGWKGKDVAGDMSRETLHFLPDNPQRRTINLQNDANSNVNVYVHSPEFSLTLTRKDGTTAESLLSTARGPLILTDSFWELTLYITNGTLYGLNQLQLNGTNSLIYNNEYGTATPAFVGIDDNGRGTACYVSYEGPMEIRVMDKSNLVVLRGFSLPRTISLNVFAGPSPLLAVRQLTKALHKTSRIDNLPVTSLGLHVCPNDDSSEFIKSLITTIDDLKAHHVPWDSHCLHQSFNPTLGILLNELQSKIVENAVQLLTEKDGDGGRILVPHLSPMLYTNDNILARKLANESLLLSNSSGPYVGSYYSQSVVYPDWFDPKTFEISLPDLTNYLNKFAASRLLYVRDSWPKDESTKHREPTNLQSDYVPKELTSLMSGGTVPYSLMSLTRRKSHYAEHNAYSECFRNSTMLEGWTSLTIRGLWGESGHSSWAALRAAIRVGVGSGAVGQLPPPMYICGTGKDLGPGENNDELCSRWYGAAVAWPHVLVLPVNSPGGEHLGETASTNAVKHLKLRASLLTYTRTKLAEHYAYGSPILAPTSIYYPGDIRVRDRWNQFLWGDSILVGLVALPRVSQVGMWLPGKYPWRHLRGGTKLYPSNENVTSITAAEGEIVTLIRPGYIVPYHKTVAMTSAATLKKELTLLINLACDSECLASGKIFYGENHGEFLSIDASNATLRLTNIMKVNEIACDSSVHLSQATLIKYVEILGTKTYDVAIELCNLPGDSYSITFNNPGKL